jgi:hypothetical protein
VHILLPLLLSDFLSDTDIDTLSQAPLAAAQLCQLLHEYGDIDFRPLRDQYLPHNWDEATDFNSERAAMFTACTFFYQRDMACHRDVVRIMRDITPYVDHNTLHEVERIYTQGIPRLCIAESTDRKTRDYMKYGIYSSCNDAPDKTKKSKNVATLSFWMNSCAGTSYISIYVQLGLLTWTIPSESNGSYMMRFPVEPNQ